MAAEKTDQNKDVATSLKDAWGWYKACDQKPTLTFLAVSVYLFLIAIYCVKRGINYFDFVSSISAGLFTLGMMTGLWFTVLYFLYYLPVEAVKKMQEELKTTNLASAILAVSPFAILLSGAGIYGFLKQNGMREGIYPLAAILVVVGLFLVSVVACNPRKIKSLLTDRSGKSVNGLIMLCAQLVLAITVTQVIFQALSSVPSIAGIKVPLWVALLVMMSTVIGILFLPIWISLHWPSKNLQQMAGRATGVLILMVFIFPGGGRFVDASLFLMGAGGGMQQVVLLDGKVDDALTEALAKASGHCEIDTKPNAYCAPIRFISANNTYVAINDVAPTGILEWLSALWRSKESLVIPNRMILARYPPPKELQ
ncbi:hypothetical protein [Varunaivibrio sulfuroxidans]|uniref:Uncharacterized protein n=1 Tax=Varunaivibrio sulfuroxidans TaxID=1773489 RepID=A0A4R3J6R2_9PROT|nr:hypothetical protein [Varunaivibrio sulfuroxidans]TCS60553.1 hypothetical protein EDD55_11027 [Varunaivibrio sulfuroxidans]WES30043.1 hypothetical protein P3M64_10395 [Varunaivibrio sulfuroxidans]